MKIFLRLFTLTLMIPIIACVLPVYAQENYNITETGEIFDYWSFVDDLVISGDYAYIISGHSDGLFIVDISTPTSPTLVGTLRSVLGGNIEAYGTHVYIWSTVEGTSTFTIVDVSDIESPVENGSFQLNGFILDMIISGNYCYVLHNRDTVSIIDISNSNNPEVCGTYSNGSVLGSIALNGNYLVVSLATETSNNIEVLNVVDPENIILIESYTVDEQLFFVDFEVNEQNLFAIVDTTLNIWEFSENGDLTLLSQTAVDDLRSGELLFNGDYLYNCKSSSIFVFNITNPAIPSFTSEYEVPESGSVIYPKGLIGRSMDNNVLGGVFADLTTGLGEYVMFIDISDPSDLLEITNYNHQEWIFDVQVQDDLLFSKGKKLRIVDIQDMSTPEIAYEIDREFDKIAHNNNHLFALFDSDNLSNNDSLFIFDFSSTDSPELINQFELPYCPLPALISISATNDFLSICYPSADDSKVEIYDIANPTDITQPALTETFSSQNGDNYFSREAVVYGNHLYILGDFGNFDLRVYEISGTGSDWSMTLQREISLSETSGDMYFENVKILNGNLVLFSWREYAIYNLDDMTNPEFVYGERLQHGSIRDIAFLDNHIFISGNFDLSITDITNPENPWVSGYYNPTYLVDHFFLDEDHIYLSSISRVNFLNYADAMGIDKDTPTSAPTDYELVKAYPNPFNPTLNIRVSLPEMGALKLTVHNVLGQEVAVLSDRTLERGYHNFTFDGSELSSGIYFVRAVVEGKMNDVQKVMLMK